MAYDKVIDSAQLDGALTATADAIRSVKDSTDPIEWDADTGFADALSDVSGGGDDPRITQIIEGTLTEIVDTNATIVGDYVLYGMRNIKKYTLPNVTQIGLHAFRASELEEIDAPKVTAIGAYAFETCPLKSINMPNVESVGNYCFDSKLGASNSVEVLCESINFPKLQATSVYCFKGWNKVSSINMPELTKIDKYTFDRALTPTSFSFPKVTTASEGSFKYCAATELDLPELTHLSTYVFENMPNLTSVKLPKAETTGQAVFRNCPSLEFIDFPSLRSIGNKFAFTQCIKLKTIILRRSTTICTLSNVDNFTTSTPFASDGEGGIILVPRDLIPAYQIATNWSTLYASGKCLFWAIEDYTQQGDNGGEIAWDYLNADREVAFA